MTPTNLEQELQKIPQVIIDKQGWFKYITLQVYIDNNQFMEFIWGSSKHKFHKQIKEDFIRELKQNGLDEYELKLDIRCEGGGWIEWLSNQKIKIFGFSYSYGQGNHERAKQLIQKTFQFSIQITTSKEGY